MLKTSPLLNRYLSAGLLLLTLGIGGAYGQTAGDAGAPGMQAKYLELAPQLTQNQFQRPLVIESSETESAVRGNAYAVINQPFSAVRAAFKDPDNWCEVLILHLNTKYCRAAEEKNPPVLAVSIGKKHSQDIKDAYSLSFDFKLVSAAADYLAVQLNSAKGPLGTNNYRIDLKAVPLAGGKTFMQLQYSYGFGMTGRLAMQGYLSTVGGGKVGFSLVDSNPGAPKKPVDGMRGAVERNTMRYYLAIEAYLAAPATEQLDKRLQHWFDATELYPRQLRELDRAAYMSMKRNEYQRQQQAAR
jgi:hypothetical protein